MIAATTRPGMPSTGRWTVRRRGGIALGVLISAVLVGCGTSTADELPIGQVIIPVLTASTTTAVPSIARIVPTTRRRPADSDLGEEDHSMQIRLTVGHRSASATLADNPTARDFALLLPVTVPITDLLGQEKTGDLPRGLDESGEAVLRYEVGQIGYWAPGGSIAILYAVNGDRAIPGPGMIPLGAVDEGLDVIAEADGDARLVIERTD